MPKRAIPTPGHKSGAGDPGAEQRRPEEPEPLPGPEVEAEVVDVEGARHVHPPRVELDLDPHAEGPLRALGVVVLLGLDLRSYLLIF